MLDKESISYLEYYFLKSAMLLFACVQACGQFQQYEIRRRPGKMLAGWGNVYVTELSYHPWDIFVWFFCDISRRVPDAYYKIWNEIHARYVPNTQENNANGSYQLTDQGKIWFHTADKIVPLLVLFRHDAFAHLLAGKHLSRTYDKLSMVQRAFHNNRSALSLLHSWNEYIAKGLGCQNIFGW